MDTRYDKKGRFLIFLLNNNNLDSHKSVLQNIFTTLMGNERFINFGKQKVIIVSALIKGEEFSFHHNILITNSTTFSEYYKEVKNVIKTNYENGYPVYVIPQFRVRVWNMDEFANKTIKISRTATPSSYKGLPKTIKTLGSTRMYSNYIKPLKREECLLRVKKELNPKKIDFAGLLQNHL